MPKNITSGIIREGSGRNMNEPQQPREKILRLSKQDISGHVRVEETRGVIAKVRPILNGPIASVKAKAICAGGALGQ